MKKTENTKSVKTAKTVKTVKTVKTAKTAKNVKTAKKAVKKNKANKTAKKETKLLNFDFVDYYDIESEIESKQFDLEFNRRKKAVKKIKTEKNVKLLNFDFDYNEIENEIESREFDIEFEKRKKSLADKKNEKSASKRVNHSRKNNAGKNIRRPFNYVIEQLQSSVTRKTIITDIVQNNAMTTSSAKSFVNSIACVLNAYNGKSKKPEGVVNQTLIALSTGGKIPKGDASSINYCKTVYNILSAKKIA